jgi:predicted TIM-barrel fold metal-dependent hydrolase
MRPPVVINCHAHPHAENEVEEKKSLWDSLGYRRVCECGASAAGNAIVARWIKRYPDYVIGFWWFDPERGAEQIDEAAELGFRGCKVINTPLPYSDERYFPLYERCQKHRFPILFHTGILAVKLHRSRQENFRPEHLGTICGAFPDLYVIGAHFGLQWYWECIMMAAYEKLYFDLSGGTWRYFPVSFFRHWFERVERNRVNDAPHMDWTLARKFVFGSDNPDDTLEFYINLLDGLGVPDEIQEQIYYKNACTLLGLNPAEIQAAAR